jgi:hypothetical protein
MQYTNKPDVLGDTIVNDDLTVITDGVPNPSAVATFKNGQYRLDVAGNGLINANQEPVLGDLNMIREPGFSGSVGWRAELQDWAEGETPNAIALGVYSAPNATGYLWTTGGYIDENGVWTVHCSPGFEPALGTDFYLAWLWGSLPVSPFTYFNNFGDTVGDSQVFYGGGDFGAAKTGVLAGLAMAGLDVASTTASGDLPAMFSPDGWEIIDAGTSSSNRFYITLESGQQDALNPELTIGLPDGNVVIPFTWDNANSRYKSGPMSGLRDKLTPFAGFYIYIELTWI